MKKEQPDTFSTKKILIVSRSFYPMNSPRSFRTTELVKEFARQGHEVTLLTPKNEREHEEFEKLHHVRIKDLGSPSLPGITLNRNNKVAYFTKRVMRRALLWFFEYPDIEWMFKVRKALSRESGYDLLISVAAPHSVHWGTALARTRKHPIAKTWVADCGDPFMLATLDSFKKLFYFRFPEKYFCKKADAITVPFEGAKSGYYPEFREKIRVVPQGFDFSVDVNGRSEKVENDVPTFGYAGGLIPGGRDPSELLNYLLSLDKDFRFILYTKSRGLVEKFANRSGGRIEIRDYIPREQLLQVMSRMDFLLNIENSTPLQKPSKLIDYYLTGRPVLSVGSNQIDRAAVDQFLAGDYSNKLDYSDIDQYRIEHVCSRLMNLAN